MKKKKKKPAPLGRPTKLSPEIQEAFCAQLATGAHIETAAAAVGVTPTCVFGWLKRGREEGSGHFFEFFQSVERTKARVVQSLLARAHQRTKSKKEGGEGADPLPLLAVIDKRYSPQVRVQVTRELESAIARIETEFEDEPETLERILVCLADETGAAEAGRNSGRASDGIAGGGEGIRAASAIAAAADFSSTPRV